MKKFILKLVLFFAICIVLDFFIGNASSVLHKTSKGGLTRKDEFIKNKMNTDIVIMGSSRASHHYVSNLIADSLRCSVYNAGMDGKGIIMNYGVLLEITRRYNPEIIIYELTPDFDWIKGDNEKYLAHLRNAYEIEGVDSIFWNVNYNEKIKMLSHSYRTNSLVPHLIYDNIFADNDSLNGYIPLWNKMEVPMKVNKKIIRNKDFKYDIDPLKAEYLQKMINLCKRKNIKLIFAVSPLIDYSENTFHFAFGLAESNNIMVINYQDMSSNYNYELFQDATHLNNQGAVRYTLDIIEKLKDN